MAISEVQLVSNREALNTEDVPLPFQRVSLLSLDVDSCICGAQGGGVLEGLDEIARRKGVFAEVSRISAQALDGSVYWTDGFLARLAKVQITKPDIIWLSKLYLQRITPFAAETVIAAREAGIPAIIASCGIRGAILPLAAKLGIPETHVFANDLYFDTSGKYLDYDTATPLAYGRKDLLLQSVKKKLSIIGRICVVGDSRMDMESDGDGLKIGFGAHVMRPGVPQIADIYLTANSFAPVIPVMLGETILRQQMDRDSGNSGLLELGLRQLDEALFNPRARHIRELLLCVKNERRDGSVAIL